MPHDTTVRATITVPPDLNWNTSRGFLADLDGALKAATGEIALDCSGLRNVTSSQIGILWQAKTRCDAAGVAMRLMSVGRGLEKVLRLLDLYDVLVARAAEPGVAVASEPEVPAAQAQGPAADSGTGNAFGIELEASADGISKAMDAFRSFLTRLDLPEMCIFDLGTAFYEVATNARQHGGLSGRGHLSFTAVYEDGKVKLRFVDSGRPFDPARQAPHFDVEEAISRRQNRGIGLFLVRKLMDSISYERVGEQNIVSLEKRVRQ
jgi:anti-sigma regulatory factor (Ser/Thr protein kinase)/anti-anti-sigma regulatory factor